MSFHKRPRFKSLSGVLEEPKKSKLKNTPCWVHKETNCLIRTKPEDKENYLWFQSMKEGKRFLELLLLLKNKQIRKLERQVSFPLTVDTQFIGTMILDFVYEEKTFVRTIYEDVKPWDKKNRKYRIDPLWAWKRKHFEVQYGKITIV